MFVVFIPASLSLELYEHHGWPTSFHFHGTVQLIYLWLWFTAHNLTKINQSINQSVNQSINRLISQLINRLINQSVNRFTNQSIRQSTGWLIHQLDDQSIKRMINLLINQSDDSSNSQSVHQLVNQSIGWSINFHGGSGSFRITTQQRQVAGFQRCMYCINTGVWV